MNDKLLTAEDYKEIASLVEEQTGKHCGKCDGKGQTAYNITHKHYEICDCIMKRGETIRKEKRKTLAEQKQVLPEGKN